jgi:hypothetical protein
VAQASRLLYLPGQLEAYMRTIAIAFVILAACGGEKSKAVDASAGSDGNPAIDAPVDSTGGGRDAAVGVTCGQTSCTGTDECCVGQGGSTCVAMGTCQTATFTCDGPEDCDVNQVCCFGGAGQGGTECKPAAQCQSNACHTTMDCGGTTPMCCPIAQSQYSVCLAHCPP